MSEKEEVKKGLTEELGKEAAQPGSHVIVFGEHPAPLPLHEETPIKLSGILDSPARWLEARELLIEGLSAHAIVDRDLMTIELITEERNHFKNKIKGSLEYHPVFLKFGINNGEYITPAQMADKIKMNRTFFESKIDAMKLVSELKNFKAKIDSAIEKANDNRGNRTDLLQQTVSSNMPESFKMVLPIFKGEQPKTLEVEVYIDAATLGCTLISPEANEETEHLRNSAINAVIDRIKEVDPTIVIIEK